MDLGHVKLQIPVGNVNPFPADLAVGRGGGDEWVEGEIS